MLNLGFDLAFPDLYRDDGLARVDAAFLTELHAADEALHARLLAARAALATGADGVAVAGAPAAPDAKAQSQLMLDLAPRVDDFIGALFGIRAEISTLAATHHELAPLYEVKRQFVQRAAAKAHSEASASGLDGAALSRQVEQLVGQTPGPDRGFELAFARCVQGWQADAAAHAEPLATALAYAGWALYTAEGRQRHAPGLLFKVPAKVDPLDLLHHAVDRHEPGSGATPGVAAAPGASQRAALGANPSAALGANPNAALGAAAAAPVVFTIKPGQIRRREGFALTDAGTDLAGALDQANYCIWCHKQGKDSCSTGLKEKPGPDGRVAFKSSALGVRLAGCPLSEKISEFHTAKVAGHLVGALAIITVDNPMAAATGHRICNDCMKSCIYQKQEPVNIPQAETRTLKDVLGLRWGFEVYSLLTRWNPLNFRQWLPRPASGYRVLVAGMGPAGYGLTHQLLNDGHTVVGIDGLKIEPLPPALGGVADDGSRVPFDPVERFEDLREDLGERTLAGFGGVAEYGITVRWDKNFLKVIRLLLQRRERFALFGGVRFGGTVTLADAWALGFDHVALAMGAGKPTTLDIPNGLARGVRTASDFLMALQLTGAAKRESVANLQVRLPVVVVGGGLTAIDTATEALAYYAVQVEKFLARAESLGLTAFLSGLQGEEREVADEFVAHAQALRAERAAALAEGRPARTVELMQQWGGSTIVYRKRLIDAPAYTLNHEEVELALQEGIAFAECLAPAEVQVDAGGAARALVLRRQVRGDDGRFQDGEAVTLPARSIFIAAGTSPNTVLAREDADHFKLAGKYFAAVDASGQPVKPESSNSKPAQAQVLMSRTDDGRFVSFFGDLHPSYFGNVVKALGSAKQGYPVVTGVLRQRVPAGSQGHSEFIDGLNRAWRATVHEVRRLTPTIVEVVVKAPAAARAFKPGQFYRLQNFDAHSAVRVRDGQPTRLAMEGLALTGAATQARDGLLSTIVLEMGGSSDLCDDLRPGEPVVLMGPTGEPTHIAGGETVLLAGGGLGNAVLFSIGAAFRAAGSKVLYFAGYKRAMDRYKIEEIEAAADVIVWCCDEQPGFTTTRPQDRSFVGNIVQAMVAYASGALGAVTVPLGDVDRLIAIGSDRMMAAVAAARHGALARYLKPGHCGIGSINSPMQCMMKEICAQCLQQHRLPDGSSRIVFTCFNQDQDLDRVDWPHLNERLRQNSVQEKLTARWIAAVRAA